MDRIIAFTPQIKNAVFIFVFILLDIITGLIKAIATGTYSSSVMRQGLFHKLGEIICLFFGVFVDYALPSLGVVLPFHVSSAIIIYIAIMETGSIIENIGMINPDLGKYLTGIFEKIKDSNNKIDE